MGGPAHPPNNPCWRGFPICTVTLHSDPSGLVVTMNRDEARTRGAESAPVLAQAGTGVYWLAPRDSDSGGTWMGLNDRGLVACLLNRYHDANVPPASGRHSRGDLVPQALAHATLAAARAWLETNVDLCPYAPFTLVLADRCARHALAWDGRAAAWSDLPAPWALVTSSFFEPERVLPWRQHAFNAWLAQGAPSAGPWPGFHVLQPEGEAFCAPLMSRAVSCTRSITQAVLAPGAPWQLRYAPVDGQPGPVTAYTLNAADGTSR